MEKQFGIMALILDTINLKQKWEDPKKKIAVLIVSQPGVILPFRGQMAMSEEISMAQLS